jgi:hypothetical protein
MTIKTVTSFARLMQLAGELGRAKKAGDPERITAAQRAHDEYKDLALRSDEMLLHCTYGDLHGRS